MRRRNDDQAHPKGIVSRIVDAHCASHDSFHRKPGAAVELERSQVVAPDFKFQAVYAGTVAERDGVFEQFPGNTATLVSRQDAHTEVTAMADRRTFATFDLRPSDHSLSILGHEVDGTILGEREDRSRQIFIFRRLLIGQETTLTCNDVDAVSQARDVCKAGGDDLDWHGGKRANLGTERRL